MTITADTPATAGAPPTRPTLLPTPTVAQVDQAVDLVERVYRDSTPAHRDLLNGAHTVVLAGEVARLRTLDELRTDRARLAPSRPPAADVERALVRADVSSRFTQRSLITLAAEVRALQGMLDAELARTARIAHAWRGLDVDTTAGQTARLAVQAAAGPGLLVALDGLDVHPAGGA